MAHVGQEALLEAFALLGTLLGTVQVPLLLLQLTFAPSGKTHPADQPKGQHKKETTTGQVEVLLTLACTQLGLLFDPSRLLPAFLFLFGLVRIVLQHHSEHFGLAGTGTHRVAQSQVLRVPQVGLPQVTMAKVDGRCRGGGFEFMLALDMCFATDESRFCFPEAACGFLPSGGGATLLPLKAGSGRALEIMTTGRDFSGTEASQYGFINRSFASATELDQYVATTAHQVGKRDLAVIQAIKSVSKATMAPLKDGLLAGLAAENEAMVACLSVPAVQEGLRKLSASEGTRDAELDLLALVETF